MTHEDWVKEQVGTTTGSTWRGEGVGCCRQGLGGRSPKVQDEGREVVDEVFRSFGNTREEG